jgi:hypothetical protein
MPRHVFNCAGCNHGNTVEVPAACGCHECEQRRPVVNYYKTVMNLIRFGSLTAVLGILALSGGCYFDHWSKIRALEVAQLQDAETKKIALEQDALQKKSALDLEIERLRAVKDLNLDSYDIKVIPQPDGRIGVQLVPKVK